jgi:hypothetical protein
MLCLTCPRTRTCTHTYYPYHLIHPLAPNVSEIETLTETILRAQRKGRFVLGARSDPVACATECEIGLHAYIILLWLNVVIL